MIFTQLRVQSYQLNPNGRVLVVVAHKPANTNLFEKANTTIVPLGTGAAFNEIYDNADASQVLSEHGRVCLAFARANDAENFVIYLLDNGAEEQFDPE